MTKEYPMTYEEFKKRVCELFMKRAKSDQELEDIKKFLKDEEGVIKGEYKYACSRYDHWEERGPAAKKVFTEDGLIHQPVRILDMLY